MPIVFYNPKKRKYSIHVPLMPIVFYNPKKKKYSIPLIPIVFYHPKKRKHTRTSVANSFLSHQKEEV